MQELDWNPQFLREFRRGHERALTLVFDCYSDDVVRFLGSRALGLGAGRDAVLSPLDLEAAHQETFVRAFSPTARERYDGVRPYRPYLLTIAKSAAFDLVRAKGRLSEQTVSLDPIDFEALEDERGDPEALALAAETRAALEGFLRRASDDERRLVDLRFDQGLSQVEAAEQMGWTRSELRTREKRLRDALSRFLEELGWLVLPGKVTR